ncbi:hypothetical protein L596_001237 [Steinernema carpocapsae]|uniref:Uncharacterized protein n=1 Tax=Steinernema carpocapsae TaxID=34508 RepID=A0A4U8UMQ9_STECR|nr:hypothetical protein L596_001237 [Steinernema carpocapsae]
MGDNVRIMRSVRYQFDRLQATVCENHNRNEQHNRQAVEIFQHFLTKRCEAVARTGHEFSYFNEWMTLWKQNHDEAYALNVQKLNRWNRLLNNYSDFVLDGSSTPREKNRVLFCCKRIIMDDFLETFHPNLKVMENIRSTVQREMPDMLNMLV